MIIDPPDGRLPPLTPEGEKRLEETRNLGGAEESAQGATTIKHSFKTWEELSPYVRCITRGIPGMMMPGIYNNGMQIVQSPGYVAIQKEMIHETRLIPTTPREQLGSKLTLWLGDPRGHWEGDTLVVETANFNGRARFRCRAPR